MNGPIPGNTFLAKLNVLRNRGYSDPDARRILSQRSAMARRARSHRREAQKPARPYSRRAA